MRFDLKQIFARGPEKIDSETVAVREIPIEELGLTFLYILIAAAWVVFADDVFDWIMGIKVESPLVQTLKGINFVTTTGLVLYLVLRRTSRRRRLALEALRLSQQRFESVAMATTDAIWDLNLQTKVVWWSEGVQKLFGYRPEDVSSKFEWWLHRVHPEDQSKVMESVGRIVESGGRTWSSEYRFRRQDDSYAVVLDRSYVIKDANGKPVRIVGGISDISERRLAEQAIENSRQQLRALTGRIQSGREEERTRVAREIHDDLGQVLTALKVNLDWLERKLGEPHAEPIFNVLLERVVESGEMVESAIQSVQRIATELRPAVLDNLGLVEALKEEARRFEARNGISCNLKLPAESLRFSPQISTTIFRVFQETLTNVVRHAQATAVSILLEARRTQIVLQVEDNGKGIEAQAIADPRSLGLMGMTERASALGGHVAVAPATPRGTRVTLQLPWNETDGKSGSES